VVGGKAGFWLAVGLLVIAAVVVTGVGAVRAARNRDVAWVVAIVAAGIFTMGWLVATIYLVAIDTQRSPRLVPLDPSQPSPEGWYADPVGRHEERWWDGSTWTEHVTDRGRPGTDPV
jgi:hypothetical protein